MRIVIDLQGAQSTGSRNRGIGRYSIALAKAIIRNRGSHEVFVVLSDLFSDTIDPIVQDLRSILPAGNVRVWKALGPTNIMKLENNWRRVVAEQTREAFLASLNPDVILVSSMFEGLGDDAVTSIGTMGPGPLTAVILFDLIPLIHRKPYLDNAAVESWYLEKIEHLRRADLWLAISESSRREGIEYLGATEFRCQSISTDAESQFREIEISDADERALRERYALDRPFVMYTGGIDHRKNIEGLISAYARLPAEIRDSHRLAIVCSVHPAEKARLENLARQAGLGPGDLVTTGFVPEDDLVALYNLCTLFVFPSWHEGFGLPALEAMRCGARVIGSNTSSIPEVIGLDEALFDPRSEDAMVAALHRGLADEAYRQRLLDHGKVQAQSFSWDTSAQKAISAMERLVHEKFGKEVAGTEMTPWRPRLAYVSPLPPERSGIADYSSELLRVLAEHYQIDVIVNQKQVSDPWINKNCGIRTPDWLLSNSGYYDRVLYHFGNSAFHQHMFDLLDAVPGVVVLHDFFLSNIAAHMEALHIAPGFWVHALYEAHGYVALKERLTAVDTADVIWTYPCSLRVVRNSLGMISHSPHSLRLAKEWYGDDGEQWAVIPLLRNPAVSTAKEAARRKLGIKSSDFVVCSFGMITPGKQSLRLLEAWQKSSLARSPDCRLIYVGENHVGDYGQALVQRAQEGDNADRVQISGWVGAPTFQDYLAAADMAVQLRTLSRGETSAAVLDCMGYGLPTIVNANGSMADLPDHAVLKLPDDFDDEELVDAIEQLWQDRERRERLGLTARDFILDQHDPTRCAVQYREAIEDFYRRATHSWRGLSKAIGTMPDVQHNKSELMGLAHALAQTFPAVPRQRQILVDVSTLVERDAETGIQRVVRNVLRQWLHRPPAGYRVEPVYATPNSGYRYARRFTLGFLGCSDELLEDEPIDFAQGDMFLGLDLQPYGVMIHRDFYQELRRYGVWVGFVVYDLLSVRMPQHFVPGADAEFFNWLTVVAENDGAVCISRAVAADLDQWVDTHVRDRKGQLRISSFHMGADLDDHNGSTGLPDDATEFLHRLTASPSFLMVGTIEPRKSHAQVLAAFELLLEQGVEANLVIVGKLGWSSEAVVKKLRGHPQLGKRIFWLENVSDQYLDRIYAASICLIAASEGEGFGLPLIEAARHKLPVLARDIPVFREVAGAHAAYFQGGTPEDLAAAIRQWLELYRKDEHPRSDDMPWQTWAQSARQLMQAVGLDAAIR
ncbi:Glycosyl transferase group 1 [Devosia sp. LC5]|uniref:glycosyltransferase n=1 Tax=Devosia sp. LC5 TaxID=1502724 RepID=UPI0004E3DD58|nr:glycosyltransferase [Devosia sp. LC5]KFC64552.1 Glycosyl transferase group 1 [Devosia sp. LC5]